MDWVSASKIVPTVAPVTFKDDLETPAPERFGGNVTGRGPIEYEISADLRRKRRMPAKVVHAVEVAFAFLCHVCNQ